MASTPILQPDLLDASTRTGRWMVVIFNNEVNTFDEVVATLMEATGCDVQEAYIEAWEAHTYGQAPVHFANREECDAAAQVISRIGVATEVRPEWED